MARTGYQSHRGHSSKRRNQTQTHAQNNVARRTAVLTPLDQPYRLGAESGKCREAAAESNEEKRSELRRDLHIEKLPHQHADQKTSRNIHKHRSNGKAAGAHPLDRPTNQVSKKGSGGPTDCY